MQGTLKQLRDNFGFFETADGDVFVQRRDLPNDAQNGDQFEFQTENRGGRNPVAVNPNRLGRGAPGGERVRGRDRPDRTDRKPIEIVWPVDAGALVVEQMDDRKVLSLPLPITLRQNNRPMVGVRIQLKVNGRAIEGEDEVVMTDSEGQTFYNLALAEDARYADLTLNVTINGQVFSYHKRWVRPQPEQKACKGILVQEHDASEGKVLRTLMTHDDKPVAGKITVESVAGSVLDANVTGTTDIKTGPKLEFDSDGSLSLHVRIRSLPSGHFGGDHVIVKVVGTNLEFKPIYIPYFG